MKPKEWTTDEVAILHQLSRTHTIKQIAAQLGRSPAAVGTKAKKLGVRLRKYGQYNASAKFSDATIEQAKELMNQGYFAPEISAATGMSASHIVNIRNGYARTRG